MVFSETSDGNSGDAGADKLPTLVGQPLWGWLRVDWGFGGISCSSDSSTLTLEEVGLTVVLLWDVGVAVLGLAIDTVVAFTVGFD